MKDVLVEFFRSWGIFWMSFFDWFKSLGPGKPDARGWIGIGTFILVCCVLALLRSDGDLRESEFFKTIATLIVGAFIKDVVGWAYSATQIGGAIAASNARTLENQSSGDGPVSKDAVDAGRKVAGAATAAAERIEDQAGSI